MASKLLGGACRESAAIWVLFTLISVGSSAHSALQENITLVSSWIPNFHRVLRGIIVFFSSMHGVGITVSDEI